MASLFARWLNRQMKLHTQHRPVSWPAGWTDRQEATHSPLASVLASWLDRQTRGYTLTTSQCLGQVVGQTDETTHYHWPVSWPAGWTDRQEATHSPLASVLASWLDRQTRLHTHHWPASWPGGWTDIRGYTLTISKCLGQVVGQTDEATHSP